MASIPPRKPTPNRKRVLARRASNARHLIEQLHIKREISAAELAKHAGRVRIGNVESVVVPLSGVAIAHYTLQGKLVRIQFNKHWYTVE